MAPDRAERDLGVGSVLLDKYELRALIGEGATGRVFAAVHRKTGGACAVKLLHRGASESDRERMRREAQALARLDHPAIVRLLDYDELPLFESAFIVQELVRGRTLRAVLDEELVLPAERVVEIAVALLDALAYAHDRAVIHRDIKPENIVLVERSDGSLAPKLVDFGLVRDGQDRSNLTRQGSIAGTPRYMSPEQAWGRDDVDARTDLWSLGVVLYESLSGAPPYDGANDREVLASIVARDPVHLRSVGVPVDDSLADAVMRALVRAPEARVASAKELQRAILASRERSVSEPAPTSARDEERAQPLASTPSERAPLPLENRPSTAWRAALVALIVVALGALVRSLSVRSPTNTPVRAPVIEDVLSSPTVTVTETDDAAIDAGALAPEDAVVLEPPRDAESERRRTGVGALVSAPRRYDASVRAEDRATRGANGSPIINEL